MTYRELIKNRENRISFSRGLENFMSKNDIVRLKNQAFNQMMQIYYQNQMSLDDVVLECDFKIMYYPFR